MPKLRKQVASLIAALCITSALLGCGNDSVGTSGGSGVATVQSDGATDFVEAFFKAEAGGTLTLPNGARLRIPPGALRSDQTIRFSYQPQDVPRPGPRLLNDGLQDPNADGDAFYQVNPSQMLNRPAQLSIPYPLEEDETTFPTMYTFSPENEIAQYGNEDTRYELLEPEYNAATDEISVQVSHFSGFDLLAAGEPAYLVMDVPKEYLAPADILITLTEQKSGFKRLGMGPGPVGLRGM